MEGFCWQSFSRLQKVSSWPRLRVVAVSGKFDTCVQYPVKNRNPLSCFVSGLRSPVASSSDCSPHITYKLRNGLHFDKVIVYLLKFYVPFLLSLGVSKWNPFYKIPSLSSLKKAGDHVLLYQDWITRETYLLSLNWESGKHRKGLQRTAGT